MICVTLSKMADGLDQREATLPFIEEIHNCPDLWDISSPAYKDTNNKQTKMEQLGLYAPREGFLLMYGFVQIFLFFQRFLFLLRRLT